MTTPDIPEAVYEAAARGWVNTNLDVYTNQSEEALAAAARRVMRERMVTVIVDAVWPLAVAAGRAQAAADIRAHADKHAPKDGNWHQATMRRHLFIAERVAAGPMTHEEVAQALNAMFADRPPAGGETR